MGGVFKAIGKAVKSVFKGIGKVFKAVAKGVKKLFSSKFGKILLIAAAVFFGGAAVGLWANPFAATAATTAAGTGASSAATMVTGAEAAAATGGGLAEVAGIPGAAASGLAEGAVAGATGAVTGAEALAPVATAGLDTGGSVIAGAAASPATSSFAVTNAAANAAGISPAAISGGEFLVNLPTTAAQFAAAEGAASTGFFGSLGSAASSVGGWMAKNPMLTMIGGNMLSSMFGNSKADDMIEYEEWLRKNSTYAGVGYDGGGPGVDLGGMEDLADKYRMGGPMSQNIPSQSWEPRKTAYVPTNYNTANTPMPVDPYRQGLLAKYYGGA